MRDLYRQHSPLERTVTLTAGHALGHLLHLPWHFRHGLAHGLAGLVRRMSSAQRRSLSRYIRLNPGGPMGHYLSQLIAPADEVLQPLVGAGQEQDPTPQIPIP